MRCGAYETQHGQAARGNRLMAKTEVRRAKKDNFLIGYLKETRAELRKVHWPSQEEARMLTLVVLAVTITMAAFLGVLDYVFDRLLNGIVKLNPLAIVLSLLIVVGIFAVGYVITREE
jgi:preprotein translocase subunit SecE